VRILSVLRFIVYFLLRAPAGGKSQPPSRVRDPLAATGVARCFRTPFVAEIIRMGGVVSTRERRFERLEGEND
jgi:hypothetical protein